MRVLESKFLQFTRNIQECCTQFGGQVRSDQIYFLLLNGIIKLVIGFLLFSLILKLEFSDFQRSSISFKHIVNVLYKHTLYYYFLHSCSNQYVFVVHQILHYINDTSNFTVIFL